MLLILSCRLYRLIDDTTYFSLTKYNLEFSVDYFHRQTNNLVNRNIILVTTSNIKQEWLAQSNSNYLLHTMRKRL